MRYKEVIIIGYLPVLKKSNPKSCWCTSYWVFYEKGTHSYMCGYPDSLHWTSEHSKYLLYEISCNYFVCMLKLKCTWTLCIEGMFSVHPPQRVLKIFSWSKKTKIKPKTLKTADFKWRY